MIDRTVGATEIKFIVVSFFGADSFGFSIIMGGEERPFPVGFKIEFLFGDILGEFGAPSVFSIFKPPSPVVAFVFELVANGDNIG